MTRGSFTILLAVLLSSCRSGGAGTSPLRAGYDTEDEPSGREEESRPGVEPWEPKRLALRVPNFGDAVVVLPKEERTPGPLLVAAHGAGGEPDFDCDHWSRLTRGEWFVLCPRGKAISQGYEGSYYYPNHHELEREVVAMLAAARAEHADALLGEPGVYAGFSQGATMGALMAIDHGRDFRALVLVEGGWSEWTLRRAQRFRETGGESVALICGGAGCTARARTSAQILERAGLRVHVEHVEGAGHTFLGPVAERAAWVFDAWPLLQGR